MRLMHYLKKSRHHYQQMMEILPLRNINQVGKSCNECQTIENRDFMKKTIGKNKTKKQYRYIQLMGPNVKILTTKLLKGV